MTQLNSWNRIPKLPTPVVHTLLEEKLPDNESVAKPLLAYGNGRSYGDVCLNDHGTILHTRQLDRFIHFDSDTGLLRCQAGITLQEILQIIVPRGWFLPVTPGTRYATVGGALANDVHGKNHHAAGTFAHHVKSFELIRSDGERLVCSPQENADFFQATVGGLGLTGLIAWVELQLVKIDNAWMWVQSQRFSNLDEFWQLNEIAEQEWPYTVAWIDCLAKENARGRGIIFAGRHASDAEELSKYKERSLSIPFDPPISLINNISLRSFNTLYYRQAVKPEGAPSHYIPYFYPLDKIENWNRIYGHKGFYQYQCVLPPNTAKQATAELLDAIAESGQGSFLAVLKTFGDKPSLGMLSFARPGATLALDFPDRGDKTMKLFTMLDDIVSQAGGALYPAKDARMSPELFRLGYPQWEDFSKFIDPSFSSHFWQRVTI